MSVIEIILMDMVIVAVNDMQMLVGNHASENRLQVVVIKYRHSHTSVLYSMFLIVLASLPDYLQVRD